MSIGSEFHEWLNDQPWTPDVINWNIARPITEDPWYVMDITDATDESLTMCASSGGVLSVEIRGFGSERYGTYEIMEALRGEIKNNLRRALPTFEVWKVQTTGTVSLGADESQINEYSFEVLISWEQ